MKYLLWMLPVAITAMLLMPTEIQSGELDVLTGGVPCDTTGLRDEVCPSEPNQTCPATLKYKKCKSPSTDPAQNVELCDPNQGNSEQCKNGGYANNCASRFDDETSTNCTPGGQQSGNEGP